jgi:hypothetical protein
MMKYSRWSALRAAPIREQTMTTSFWKDAAASLPPAIRDRYAADFKAAERYEHLMDLSIEGWGIARRALARGCQVAAHALRATARFLDNAARRIRPHIAGRSRSR